MMPRGFSILKTIVTLLVVLALGSFVAHTALSWIPRNLQGVDGMDGDTSEEPVADLKARLKDSIEKSYEITITEAEINRYIAANLKLTQSSIVANYVTIKGIYVDVKPGALEITIEREFDAPENQQADGTKKVPFLPLSQTVSMRVEIVTLDDESGGKRTLISFPGGEFGTAPAPGLLANLVKDSFDIIMDTFSEEIDMGFEEMTSITLEDGVIKLDPRPIIIERKNP